MKYDYAEAMEHADQTMARWDKADAILSRLTIDNVEQIRQELHRLE